MKNLIKISLFIIFFLRKYFLKVIWYDGLRHKALFDVKKIIYYPGGGEAFILVSKK